MAFDRSRDSNDIEAILWVKGTVIVVIERGLFAYERIAKSYKSKMSIRFIIIRVNALGKM